MTAAAFGAGLVSATLWFSAAALFVSPSMARSDTSKFQLDADTFRILNDLGYTLWFGGTTIAAVTVIRRHFSASGWAAAEMARVVELSSSR